MVVLHFSGQSNPVQADAFSMVTVQDFDGVAVDDSYHLGSKICGNRGQNMQKENNGKGYDGHESHASYSHGHKFFGVQFTFGRMRLFLPLRANSGTFADQVRDTYLAIPVIERPSSWIIVRKNVVLASSTTTPSA